MRKLTASVLAVAALSGGALAGTALAAGPAASHPSTPAKHERADRSADRTGAASRDLSRGHSVHAERAQHRDLRDGGR